MHDQPVRYAGDIRLLHDLLHLCGAPVIGHSLRLCNKGEVFLRSHIGIEGRYLGKIPDPLFGLFGLLKDVIAVDCHTARGGGQASGHDVHRWCLAGSVGPEQSVDPAVFDGEGQIADRRVRAVFFCQVLYFDQGRFPPKKDAARPDGGTRRRSVLPRPRFYNIYYNL